MKKVTILTLLIGTIFVLSGCTTTTSIDDFIVDNTVDTSLYISEDFSEDEILEYISTSLLELTETEVKIDYELDQNDVDDYTVYDGTAITEKGMYLLEGTITETIIVDVDGSDDVTLLLNNVTISVEDGPAILVLSCDDVTISSLDGTTNYISDSSTRVDDYIDYNSVIYSFEDLYFNGTGILEVTANYNNAIYSKDDIKIVETHIIIESIDDAIVGRDSVIINEATLEVECDGDAIKTTNDEDTLKGYIYIIDGTFTFDCSTGLNAINKLLIENGTFTIDASDNGIVSDVQIIIGNGVFTIDSVSDSINSKDDLIIFDGTFDIYTSDDGIHSDNTLTIEGGEISIHESYEGIEGYVININGGNISINSDDDGLNATLGGGQIHDPENYVSDGGTINITGGVMLINAISDGIDANGTINATGGYVVVFGSTEDNQSPIDYDYNFNVDGGTIIAFGATGMIQSISDGSTSYAVLLASDDSYSAGTEVVITDEANNVLITVTTIKSFTGMVYTSDELSLNEDYFVYVNSDTFDLTINDTTEVIGEGSYGTGPGGTMPGPGRP